ncbi:MULTISPECIES: response regulator transcription factor [Alkalihalophilus]|uniref:DNA-binding response regulator n=1 Tax=Alkalihalophilus pseudofirmus (strain ATCC BAA-2126 / JCM 17055 / OF4) TaxID=398511 RepID=D3FV99_ALKPO|nr:MULTISPECIES: response regulator transcription factor [Alkalihalophilus]ADC50300.1 DNA-binding response regulator [Alkalihalophilus pseudofirmus OF4]MEC2072022.1 response regulator transcription factor [Alkalihalophilus marmarensis]
MNNARILIVEDEANIARVIELELEHEGYETEIAADGLSALEQIEQGGWSLILLDVMLPRLSGMEVLRRIRKEGNTTPVIMLTARDTIVDKVMGLDQGANDYVTKPFEIEELLARIRACLRTQLSTSGTHLDEGELTLADLYVNERTREIKRGETTIELTPREFDLLVYLLRHPEQVMTREQILEHVWGFDYFGDTNVVDVYIRYMRQKLDKPFDAPLIHTVRGVGYVMKESVT